MSEMERTHGVYTGLQVNMKKAKMTTACKKFRMVILCMQETLGTEGAAVVG